ncbi:hypothetical protein BASA81_005257 [Batrachochytrium salamandrivorans]|nr:hypothetical protein BASA81_005257 [Batrachochytrium salamandrivorans]
MRISIATVCSVAISTLPSVTAWGVIAHKTIGLIAKQFLTKEGSAYVDAYLHQQSMESIGSWADTERKSSRESDTAEYHFTNSMDPSKAKCVYDDHRDCSDGICLSGAMARHNKILMESTSPDDPGAEDSLKYLIHYISDSCQPLHTSGYDKGGSSTMARFGSKSYSLHSIWDMLIPNKRVLDDFQNSAVVYANYLIRSIKTGENKVLSKSWTSKLPIDAVNDIGNSMVAIEYTAESYELSCSVVWPKYNEHRKKNLDDGYYRDVFKTLDMQISKAGLRVAHWLNQLARLNPQTAVEAAIPPTAQPGKSNTKKHPLPPQESMPQSKKDPSMSSKKLASGAQKPDDPLPSSSDHDDHQVVDDADTEWQVVKKKCPRSGTATTKGKGGNSSKGKGATRQIPGLPRDTNPIRGLMYADDVAVFADSEQSLLAALTAVEQWANQWEMQFGVAKCGIISFTGHLAPRLDTPLDIRLHGQLVSRVGSYKYLGVLIDSKLDHSAWLKQKRSALEHTISALYPVLANHQLTVNY